MYAVEPRWRSAVTRSLRATEMFTTFLPQRDARASVQEGPRGGRRPTEDSAHAVSKEPPRPEGVRRRPGPPPGMPALPYGATEKFTTLESVSALNAEVRMPTSPVASTPTGRGPLKVTAPPTWPSTSLFGSVGTLCLNTFPVMLTAAPFTTTSMVTWYHVLVWM